MFETIFAVMFGAVSYIIVALIPYIDSVNILLKITKIFSSKEPRGYGDYQKVRKSVQYKNHRKKWIKKKMLLLGMYFVLFILSDIVIRSAWLSMVISFIITILIMALKSNREHAELQKIQQAVNSTD